MASKRQNLSQTLGALGYLSLILQWAWALILLLPPLLKLDGVQNFVMQRPSHTPAPPPTPITLPPLLTFGMVAFAFVIVLVGIYFAIKSPAYAVRSTDKTARKAASSIAHRTAKRPENVREVRALSARLLWILKWCAVLIGLLLTLLAAKLPVGLDSNIIVTVGGYLTIWPVLWFGLEYLLTPHKKHA